MLPWGTLRDRWALLVYGVMMAFCSGFGQTYFVSVFGGEVRDAFKLDHATYGALYAAGTIASSAVLLWAGRLIDRWSLTAFSVTTAIGLAAATGIMSVAAGYASLVIAFFALRFFGQGLMVHAAMTAMARYFIRTRGTAVSIASLGHVLGQAVWPPLIVALLALLTWRHVWLAGAGFLLLVLVPAVVYLLSRPYTPPAPVMGAGNTPSRAEDLEPAESHTLADALRDPGLYLRLPVLLAPAFITTGLIFHQVHIAGVKGWPTELVAASFSVLAIGSFVMTLVTGPVIDRLTAARILPFGLLPMALSATVLALFSSALAAPAYFGLMGVGSGATQVIMGALWAEVYGTRHIGAIRAFAVSAMVFTSGLAPPVIGLLLDRGVSLEAIGLGTAAYCLAASALSALAGKPPNPRSSLASGREVA